MFTLAISCLPTSNLPWFMDLTFQVLMQYCYLQHIHNLSLFSLWLHLFILSGVISHFSPVVYLALTDLKSLSFSFISFCLFILFMGFSRQEIWSGLPSPSPVGHVLSELSTMTCLSWVPLRNMVHRFIKLDKTVIHVISLVSFLDCGFHSFCPQMVKVNRCVKI